MTGNPPFTGESFSAWAERVWQARRAREQRTHEGPAVPPKGAGEGEINMDGTGAAVTRQRVMKFVEEGQDLFDLLPGLLDENERLRAKAATAEQECERLRQENAGLRKEQEELVGDFGRLMAEMLRPMNEMMQKIRGTSRKSPLERDPSTEALDEPSRLVSSGVAGQ